MRRRADRQKFCQAFHNAQQYGLDVRIQDASKARNSPRRRNQPGDPSSHWNTRAAAHAVKFSGGKFFCNGYRIKRVDGETSRREKTVKCR
jgi:hypothetical protein